MTENHIIYTHVGLRAASVQEPGPTGATDLPYLRVRATQLIDHALRTAGLYPHCVIATPGVQVLPADNAFPRTQFPPVMDTGEVFKLVAAQLLEVAPESYARGYVEDRKGTSTTLVQKTLQRLNLQAVPPENVPDDLVSYCSGLLHVEAMNLGFIDSNDTDSRTRIYGP